MIGSSEGLQGLLDEKKQYPKIYGSMQVIKTIYLIMLCCSCSADIEQDGRKYMEDLNKLYLEKIYEVQVANWNYVVNINPETQAKKLAMDVEWAKFEKEKWQEVIKFPWQSFKDEDLKRQFKYYAVLGESALPDDKLEKYKKSIADMIDIFSTAKVCDFHNKTKCDLSLDPDIQQIFATSRDVAELKYYWLEWKKQTGPKIRPIYKEYVTLFNEVATLNNFTSAAEYWQLEYESPDFVDILNKLWEQLKPLYMEIHAYMRRKLREKYGEAIVPKSGPIPAHLFGNLWAQDWSNIEDIVEPFKNTDTEDVTKYLVEQGYTPLKMFKLAEEFYTSINLSPMTEEFWKNSLLEKPPDREVDCGAAAWDFSRKNDFRIKQCTQVTKDDLLGAHHEMGHVEYYMQFQDLPYCFGFAANAGFDEAIGDTVLLSVNQAQHFNKIKLLPSVDTSQEAELYNLFKSGLVNIAFIPFSLWIDLWRWNVFKGIYKEENWNTEWWNLCLQYQGMVPPEKRSENDFDPASKYHIVANFSYIRYFVGFVIQFQFHEALCTRAGQYDPKNPNTTPLHKCDIYQSKEAGNLFKEMMKLGSSKPWPDALAVMTGRPNMDAQSVLSYFNPLYNWLKEDNKKNGEPVGWDVPS